ncbi:hypothetical protein PWT90_06813 [Aphanocladium album]|nr:hypothetical protein PWT90_06813 [Aphanocladium album]
MPTLLDSTLKSKNMVLAFGGVVAAATVWMLSGDMFPADPDPKGDPETWTREEMRRWLEAVSCATKTLSIAIEQQLTSCTAQPFPAAD